MGEMETAVGGHVVGMSCFVMVAVAGLCKYKTMVAGAACLAACAHEMVAGAWWPEPVVAGAWRPEPGGRSLVAGA